MTTRANDEYDKFVLDSWNVILRTAEWTWPASAVLEWERNDLESKKFTTDWKVRVITTF